MGKTSVEWATKAWNVIDWWCTKVSAGCDNCYVERLAERYGKVFDAKSPGFLPRFRYGKLREPLSWKTPQRVFVNDMGDTFHRLVPDDLITAIVKIMLLTPQHQYLILTKRINRMARYFKGWKQPVSPNIWVGTSIENRAMLARMDMLKIIDAPVRWLSVEPLLESLGEIDLRGIHWVIVGGETGPAGVRREMDLDWVREIRDQCAEQGVPFFFKQSSGPRPGMNRELDGRLWEEFPMPLKEMR